MDTPSERARAVSAAAGEYAKAMRSKRPLESVEAKLIQAVERLTGKRVTVNERSGANE